MEWGLAVLMNNKWGFCAENLVNFTQKLIQIPSLSTQEQEIAKAVAGEMKKLNYDEVYIDEKNNVVGTIKGVGGGPTLLFNGHIDHAGVGNMKEPFSGKILDGTKYGHPGPVIYGRGASDMKAAIAAMVYAAGAIKEQGISLRGDVLVTAVAMEEMAYGEGISYLLDNGLRADFAVSGEATNLNVYVGHRGKIEFKIITKGKTSHAGFPAGGVNAIFLMNKFLNKLQEKYSLPNHQFLGKASYTVIDIAASPGRLTPIVPDHCEIILDRRFLPEETPEMLDEHLWKIIGEVKNEDPLFDADVELVKVFPAMLTDPGGKIVKAVKEARRMVMGDEGEIGAWYFGVDGTFIERAGIPCAGFGPGNEHYAHTPEDHVPVDHVVTAAKVYSQLIIKLCC